MCGCKKGLSSAKASNNRDYAVSAVPVTTTNTASFVQIISTSDREQAVIGVDTIFRTFIPQANRVGNGTSIMLYKDVAVRVDARLANHLRAKTNTIQVAQ